MTNRLRSTLMDVRLASLFTVVHFSTVLITGFFISGVTTPTLAGAEPNVDVLEELALGEHATAAAHLDPGSAEQWYWRIVHAQLTDPPAAARLLDAAERVVPPDVMRQLRLRQAAITWNSDPHAAEFLAETLTQQNAPRATTPEEVTTELSRLCDFPLNLEPHDYDVDGVVQVLATATSDRRHNLLGRLDHASTPAVVAAIIRDLNDQTADTFGSLPIHTGLTIEQLSTVAGGVPAIVNHPQFMRLRLKHLAGLHDATHWQIDPRARRAYCEALLAESLFYEANRPELVALRLIALEELVILDVADGWPTTARIQEWYAAKSMVLPENAPPGNKSALTRDEVFQLTGLSGKPVDQAIEFAVDHHLAEVATAPEWAECLGRGSVAGRQMAARIVTGIRSADQVAVADTIAALGGPKAAQLLHDRTELAWWPGQESALSAIDAPVTVRLIAKHLDRLAVRVWRIDEEAVLRTKDSVEISMDLTANLPLATIAVPLRADPWLRQQRAIPLPQISGSGTWLIEAMGDQRAIRLLVRRGAIEVITTSDALGNRAVVVDQLGQVVLKSHLWMSALCLHADDRGVIRLPDGRNTYERLVAVGGGHASVSTIRLPDEVYHLAGWLLNAREHLLAGTNPTLVFGAHLSRGLATVSLTALREPQVTLRWQGRAGKNIASQSLPLHLTDDQDVILPLTVPEGAMTLQWRLEAQVLSRSTGREVTVNDHGVINLSPGIAEDALSDHVVRREPEGWLVELRGNAGEPLPGHWLDIGVTVRGCRIANPMRSMKTDSDGKIHLGKLPQAMQIHVHNYSDSGRTWATTDPPLLLPENTVLRPGETMDLPLAESPQVFRVHGETYIAELPDALKRTASGWSVHFVNVGNYRIHDSFSRVEISVRQSTATEGNLLVGAGVVAQVPVPEPVISAHVTATMLELRLTGLSSAARVHLVPLRLWPTADDLAIGRYAQQRRMLHDWVPLGSSSGSRTVGDEEWYLSNRRDQHAFAGVMLDRPTPLLDPWHPDEPLCSSRDSGIDTGILGNRSGGGRKRAVGKGGCSADYQNIKKPNFLTPDWLAAANPMLLNVRLDAAGLLSVPLSSLGDAAEVFVLGTDGDQLVQKMVSLPARIMPLPVRNRHLIDLLPFTGEIGVSSGFTALQTGERLDLPSLPGSRIRLIDSVGGFIGFIRAAWPNLDLGPFAQLGQWAELDPAARRRLWDAGASHELHLFLAHHDPDFAAMVTAYRRQVLVPDAMLSALCDVDPTPWLRAGAPLNPIERMLLAECLAPPDAGRWRRLLDDAARDIQSDPPRRTAMINALLASTIGAGSPLPVISPPARKISKPLEISFDSSSNNPLPILRGALGEPERMIESRWWHCATTPPIADNPLWAAYASRDPHRAFLPTTGLELIQTATELRVVLAITDLPFVPREHQWQDTSNGRTLTAAGPLIVAHRLVSPLPRGTATVALYRRTCALGEWDSEPVKNSRMAPSLTSPLAVGVPYVDEIVALNLSPQPMDVEVLAQIPSGAVALGGDAATMVQQIRLDGYGSTTIGQRWYLPHGGSAKQAPATVTLSSAGTATVVASAAQRTWETAGFVPDSEPWTTAGEDTTVLASLARENLTQVDLSPVVRRCAEPAFYKQAIATLRARGAWDADIWAWSLRHHDTVTAGEWLSRNSTFRAAAGPWLASPVITIDAVAEGDFEPMEVSPLVNPRQLRARPESRDVNELVRDGWMSLLRYVAHKPSLSQGDRLMVTCLLLNQDRIGEALDQFATITPESLPARIQYDWCAAWLALASGTEKDLEIVRRLSKNYGDHPIEHWRQRWQELAAQMTEIDGAAAHRSGPNPAIALAVQAANEASVSLMSDAFGNVAVIAHSPGETTVAIDISMRPLDLAAIFNRDPFTDLSTLSNTELHHLSEVTALDRISVSLAGDGRSHLLELPPSWRLRPHVIEAQIDGSSAYVALNGNDLDVRIAPASGLLTVNRRSTGAPVPAAYISVMSLRNKTAALIKDGYTDQRGRFDYVAINGTNNISSDRIALLIDAGDLGAVTVQTLPVFSDHGTTRGIRSSAGKQDLNPTTEESE